MSDAAGGDGDRRAPEELPAEIREAVPDYDDEYLDRVSDRLMYSYDLDADVVVDGERFELTAEMRMRNQKQFLHPALSYADHDVMEHLFARRVAAPTVGELERLVEFAHGVADERVDGNEQHYGTDITVVLVADRIPEDVAEFVDGFRDRTLLKLGYYGHYEVNLVVVAPDEERLVASEAASSAEALRLWEPVEKPDDGIFSRFAKRFWR
ncbi:hypothetical protein [Halorubrum sp. CBA1229]|jgi:hypothetical protein|uniref:hypothetical protein n=1 Tax=Halorubrum sp. CBA1229 TaxID=1853699 RepID=UPI000F3B6FE9|nr:hypothetical protein [Halorubrum sp. CBA1229]QKY16658.1 hypothetical protein Hrr1229_007120 [Halorubrum sp. CBA1229]